MYLNLTPVPYLLCRYEEAGAAYREGLSGLLSDAGLEPLLRVYEDGEELVGIESLLWEKDEKLYLCLMWNALPKAKVDGTEIDQGVIDGPERTITIRLSGPAGGLKNLRTGKTFGEGGEFTDTWLPCEANVYELMPAG